MPEFTNMEALPWIKNVLFLDSERKRLNKQCFNMSPTNIETPSENGRVKQLESVSSLFETEDPDLSRLLENPRALNIERKRSFDERSFSEMSISSRIDHFDIGYSPSRMSGFNSPRSARGFASAREQLTRSLLK